jgi:NAD dependent epimerase/dehydratase family enzyme
MRTLARAVRRPTLIAVPEFAVRLVYGEMGQETVLDGQRATPRQLIENCFHFEHPTLEQALAYELKSA